MNGRNDENSKLGKKGTIKDKWEEKKKERKQKRIDKRKEKRNKLKEETYLKIEDPDKDNPPSQEFLIQCYSSTWADVHHSRSQDWRLLELIGIIFVAMIGISLKDTYNLQYLIVDAIGVCIIGLSLFGITISSKHRRLFDKKMKLIGWIENHLGLTLDWEKNNAGDSEDESLLRVSDVIKILYSVLISASLVFCVIFTIIFFK